LDRGVVRRSLGSSAVDEVAPAFAVDACLASALASNAVPFAPEDLSSSNRDDDVIKAVPALRPKVVSFTVEEWGVKFTDDGVPSVGWGETAPTVLVDEGGLGDLMAVTQRLYQANFAELIEQIDLANRTEDSVERFMFVVEPTDGDEDTVSPQREPVGYSLRRITAAGKGEIKVSKIPLTHGRLGDWNVNFGYGEGKVGGRDALLVVWERDKGGGQLTMRIRPLDAGKAA
jgi:hypothetical protein